MSNTEVSDVITKVRKQSLSIAKRNASILEEFEAGATQGDLARKHHRSVNTIKSILQEERAKRNEKSAR